VLPQVLVGLGALSLLSAGCLFWLERLQPVFAVLAVGALAYQGWLVWRRPHERRSRRLMAIFWTSVGINALVLVTLITLWFRYR